MIDLKSVVEKYPECLDSATKFKSYMMDLYPDNSNKARIRILADIVDCGIALEIKNGKTDSISISNFCNTMESQYGYSAKLVEECIDQFIVALGFKTEATMVAPQTTDNILKKDCAIAMIGIGGAGGNTINKAKKQNGISLISIDDGIEWTDTSKADEKISINLKSGYNNTYSIADSDVAKIDAVTSRFPIILIFAGLGGRTGTNITPTVIQSAQKHGAMVITVMTKPFLFEGKDRATIAENGENNIKEISDCYIVVANELIKFASSAKITFSNAFLFVDELIAEIVQVILKCIPSSVSSQKTISDESKKKIIEEINHLVPDYKIVESVGPVTKNKPEHQNTSSASRILESANVGNNRSDDKKVNTSNPGNKTTIAAPVENKSFKKNDEYFCEHCNSWVGYTNFCHFCGKPKNIRVERRLNGKCQHCGGDFKGIFSVKCSICGKPKDYYKV